jgi:RNA polymerase sigma factor (sigma-70 family)
MTLEDALKTLHTDPGDPEAWEKVATDIYPSLLAYVASLLLTFRIGPAETADDIVHQVLLIFYERWPKGKIEINSTADLHNYLRVSCRNLLVDRYRRERTAGRLVSFLELKFGAAFQDETELYRSIFLDEVIEMLPEECAQLFRLYVSEDLSPAEIADRIGVPPATFYSRWYRCIQRVREISLKRKGGLKRS